MIKQVKLRFNVFSNVFLLLIIFKPILARKIDSEFKIPLFLSYNRSALSNTSVCKNKISKIMRNFIAQII